MTYKVIDDETALQIYEAVQENTELSFGAYNRLRQLPRTKISGEIVFFLDSLLDFALRVLGRDEATTLQEVIDAGIVSWFGNLSEDQQRKIGIKLAEHTAKKGRTSTAQPKAAADSAATLTKKIEALEVAVEGYRGENERLTKAMDALEVEKSNLRREIAHLEKINEEMMESHLAHETAVSQPAFLRDDGLGSTYTEMTTHLLTPGQNDKGTGGKKKAARKKRRG